MGLLFTALMLSLGIIVFFVFRMKSRSTKCNGELNVLKTFLKLLSAVSNVNEGFPPQSSSIPTSPNVAYTTVEIRGNSSNSDDYETVV